MLEDAQLLLCSLQKDMKNINKKYFKIINSLSDPNNINFVIRLLHIHSINDIFIQLMTYLIMILVTKFFQ